MLASRWSPKRPLWIRVTVAVNGADFADYPRRRGREPLLRKRRRRNSAVVAEDEVARPHDLPFRRGDGRHRKRQSRQCHPHHQLSLHAPPAFRLDLPRSSPRGRWRTRPSLKPLRHADDQVGEELLLTKWLMIRSSPSLIQSVAESSNCLPAVW